MIFGMKVSMSGIKVNKPTGWRKGQTIFNFLEWLRTKKNMVSTQNNRMADPFHISDEDWDKYYEEFLNEKH